MSAEMETQKSAQNTKVKKESEGFTEDERAAMKERAKELKAEARANKKKEEEKGMCFGKDLYLRAVLVAVLFATAVALVGYCPPVMAQEAEEAEEAGEEEYAVEILTMAN